MDGEGLKANRFRLRALSSADKYLFKGEFAIFKLVFIFETFFTGI